MKFIYITLIIINLFGFILIGYDKRKAEKKGWRIPELNLFLAALLGGALGVFLGMKVFRHKTRHYTFVIGIPLLIGLNLLTVYLITRFLKAMFL